MGQPVKLSDKLVLDARLAGEDAERSIAGQIEYWAKLGRAVEALLRPANVVQLKRRAEVKPLEHYLEVIRSADSPEGRARAKAVLDAEPFPHFEPTDARDVMIRIDEDGTRTKVEWRVHDWVPVRKHK